MSTITKPYGRSLDDFLPLLHAEDVLRDAVRKGQLAKIDSNRPTEKTDTNCVRAQFLRFLTLGGDEGTPTHESGIKLEGAWISNSLNLEGCDIQSKLCLTKCHFEKQAIFRSAHIHGLLNLSGSLLPGLAADRLVVEESIFLRTGFVATETVRLVSAQIGSSFSCVGGEFNGKDGEALSFDNARIGSDVFLRDDFKAIGAVRLNGAQIGGSFVCSGGEFNDKDGKALSFDNAKIGGDIFLRGDFKAIGAVRLNGAQIGGSFVCSGGEFNGKDGKALSFDNARIEGNVFLTNGFKASGAVNLNGAHIGNDLNCRDGNFDGNEGNALSANRAKIQGSVFLQNGFKATGPVSLLNAQIGCDLVCDGGELDGKDGNALTFDHARIKNSVFLRNGFRASGEVRLLGAQIGGNFECIGGVFNVKDGDALSFDNAKIEGNVFLLDGFKANGTVRLLAAQINSDFDCTGGEFGNKNASLITNGMQVRGCFQIQGLKAPANGISLVASRVGQLADDEPSWGTGLVLDGFVYEHISDNAPTSSQMRLEWLAKQISDHSQKNFKPQPWKQLIRTLRNMGHDEESRRIAIYYETHRRKIGLVQGKLRYTFHGLFGLLIGYGYRPLRLLYIMLGVWLFCAVMFWCAALHGVFAPSNPLIFHHPDYKLCRPSDSTTDQPNDKGNWYLCPQLAGEYTGFSPLAYSLDLILPLVDLQQEHDWAPYIPAPKANWLVELKSFSKYHWTRLLIWFEILFGWLSSLLLVAVVSGLANRSNDD